MNITELYQLLFGRSNIKDGNVIEMAEHGRSGGVSTGQPFKFVDGVPYNYKWITVGQYTYVGVANPGTLEADAFWQAFRVDGTNGVLIYADGNPNYDNVGTDLTALSYS